jgi:hypothetical protein
MENVPMSAANIFPHFQRLVTEFLTWDEQQIHLDRQYREADHAALAAGQKPVYAKRGMHRRLWFPERQERCVVIRRDLDRVIVKYLKRIGLPVGYYGDGEHEYEVCELEDFRNALRNLLELGFPATGDHDAYLNRYHQRVEMVLYRLNKVLALERQSSVAPQKDRRPRRDPPSPLVCLGNRNYQSGEVQFVAEDKEETILQEFFADAEPTASWVSRDYPTLKDRTNLADAPVILRRLRRRLLKIDPELARVIDLPGKKGQGGLKVYLLAR